MSSPAILLNGVTKCFRRFTRPLDRISALLGRASSHDSAHEFWALKGISLSIPRGQTWGIVGRNGSGKSTLLQIIANTLQPTGGEVVVNGRVAALLEL